MPRIVVSVRQRFDLAVAGVRALQWLTTKPGLYGHHAFTEIFDFQHANLLRREPFREKTVRTKYCSVSWINSSLSPIPLLCTL